MAIRDDVEILDPVDIDIDLIASPGLMDKYEAVLAWIEEAPDELAYKIRFRVRVLFWHKRKTRKVYRRDLLGPLTFIMLNEEKLP